MRFLFDLLPPVLLVAAELFVFAFALGWALLFPLFGLALAKWAALGVGAVAAGGGGAAFLRHALGTARAAGSAD